MLSPGSLGGDRPSILQSLDSELKEGGSDFVIVGQVETRVPLALANVQTTTQPLEVEDDDADEVVIIIFCVFLILRVWVLLYDY